MPGPVDRWGATAAIPTVVPDRIFCEFTIWKPRPQNAQSVRYRLLLLKGYETGGPLYVRSVNLDQS